MKISSISLLILMCLVTITLAPLARGDVVIQIGDSVANSADNRAATNRWLAEKEIELTWVGDHGEPRATFARGGLTYRGMHVGTAEATGMLEIVENYAAPDLLYILGGYNNAVTEVDDSDMLESIEALKDILDLAQSSWTNTDIFVSNVTLFPESGNWGHKQSNVITLNGLIADEISVRENVYLVDNYSIIGEEDLRTDGLHLNFDGQVKIGENFGSTYYITSIPEPNSLLFLFAATVLHGMRRDRHPKRRGRLG